MRKKRLPTTSKYNRSTVYFPGCKRPREEDFLTSSPSLSFSSLSSSSCTSSLDDAIEISTTKSARTSCEENQSRGKVLNANYSPPPGSEMWCVTSHVRMEHAPSFSRPVQLMNRCLGTHYDPERIPASVFAKTGGGDVNWSEMSNDYLLLQFFEPSSMIKAYIDNSSCVITRIALVPENPFDFKSRASRSIGVSWVNKTFLTQSMGGCVACYRETRPTETVNDPPSYSVAQRVKKPSVSEDFWSTSTVDMDNITFPSQGGSISSSNQTFDSQSGARNSNPPPEFVNQGLLLWNQTRERWVAKERSNNNPPDRNHGSKINWNAASYDNLLGSNKLFPQPIPLNEMVDFLVEIWEQDGLYD
ncbi:unnamed protein product [Eruca vesicaria subsp. sativa]|uniref:Gag1-like clamp domain-containing protein n=1 Tax=Eruca vesicaria subsp. sativa TaxID=29727 RepID=A0ABC8KDX1_ERUVS|nr:unnamed protein product [Eruca vesicaria subsp. sativa]